MVNPMEQLMREAVSPEELKQILNVDIVYKFAMLLQYGDDNIRRAAVDIVFQVLPDNNIRRAVVDIVFQVLPDEVAAEMIRRYIDRVKKRYSMIKDIAEEVIYDKRPRHHDATQDTKTTVKIDVKEIPEELEQILKK